MSEKVLGILCSGCQPGVDDESKGKTGECGRKWIRYE